MGLKWSRSEYAYRKKQPRNPLFILCPALPIFRPTSLDISICSVYNHDGKESRIKPRKWAIESSYCTPSKRKVDIASIMYFSGISIPTIDKDSITRWGCDGMRILNCLPRQLRKRLPRHKFPSFLRSETILLAVRGIPNPVHKKIWREEKNQKRSTECGHGPIRRSVEVVGEVKCTMAITQRDTGQVPEYKHEPPFFIVNVPSLRQFWVL
jgi:hypothetical protein